MADKKKFVKELAKYLVEDQARHGMGLAVGNKDSKVWAAVRNTTPLFGYITVERAEKELAEWLGVSLDEPKEPKEPKEPIPERACAHDDDVAECPACNYVDPPMKCGE